MLSTKGNKYRFSYRPTEQARGVHPYRMILYLFILASSMLFLVSLRKNGNWINVYKIFPVKFHSLEVLTPMSYACPLSHWFTSCKSKR